MKKIRGSSNRLRKKKKEGALAGGRMGKRERSSAGEKKYVSPPRSSVKRKNEKHSDCGRRKGILTVKERKGASD